MIPRRYGEQSRVAYWPLEKKNNAYRIHFPGAKCASFIFREQFTSIRKL